MNLTVVLSWLPCFFISSRWWRPYTTGARSAAVLPTELKLTPKRKPRLVYVPVITDDTSVITKNDTVITAPLVEVKDEVVTSVTITNPSTQNESWFRLQRLKKRLKWVHSARTSVRFIKKDIKKGVSFFSLTPWYQLVGAARFELATSCSQSRRDNRATLRPEQN